MKSDTLTVRVGAALIEVLNLDDSSVLRHMGLDVKWEGGRFIDITGSPDALRGLIDDCIHRQGPGWDHPARYAAISKRAQRAIEQTLTAAGEATRG